MKRILSFILVGMLSLGMSLSFTACDESRTIRLCEVTHSIFYAPMYIAINKGYFEEANIKIKLSTGEGADKVMAAITSKSADIGLMGPEATIYCHVEGQINYPVIFGQLTQRDGSFLVSKTPQPDFKWSDLKDKRVLAGRPGGVPAMTLQYVIEREGGLSLDELNFDTSIPFGNMAAVFDSDPTVDYTTLFEPIASTFEKEGRGHIVASVGVAGGDIPYTAFSASKSYLKENKELVADFLRCIIKGYQFIVNNSAEEVAKALQPSFKETDLEIIEATVRRYIEIEAWCNTPAMSKSSFERLQDIMQNAGHLSSRADYDVAVDNTIANSLI